MSSPVEWSDNIARFAVNIDTLVRLTPARHVGVTIAAGRAPKSQCQFTFVEW